MHPSGQVSAAPQQRQGQGHCRRGRGVPADAKLDGPLPDPAPQALPAGAEISLVLLMDVGVGMGGLLPAAHHLLG
jgi:hypothetical protein